MAKATDIYNAPAFWYSLSDVQKAAVKTAHKAELTGHLYIDVFPDLVDRAVWQRVQDLFQVEVLDPSEKVRVEMQAKVKPPTFGIPNDRGIQREWRSGSDYPMEATA